MRELIEKAGVLVEALPYIQRFRGAIVVIKFGGSAMEERSLYESILTDIALMECVGMKPVVIHGGGKAISRRMKAAGLAPVFVRGLRVTDEAAMAVVASVLGKEVNPEIVESLAARGCRAQGIMGQNIIWARKHMETDPASGERIDLGFVGAVIGVDTGPIRECVEQDRVPVITPLGMGEDGALYNINADDAAAAVAARLRARKLVFLSDVPGLMRNPADPASVISTVRAGDVDRLIAEKVIDGGMLPKVRGGLDALRSGVGKAHIIDGRMPHSLLLEVLTDRGVGTEIVRNDQD